MKSSFDSSLYQFDQPQPSYWQASAGDVKVQGKPLAAAHSCEEFAEISNGFMPEHLHRGVEGRPLPLQSAIVVTRPMSDSVLQDKGWHTENPIFREPHGLS